MSEKTCPVSDPPQEHCWHMRDQQHAVYVKDGIHRDLQCCNCPTKKCEIVYFSAGGAHGPHAGPPKAARTGSS